jgi:Carboxypeptidase regulatory-like domain
MKTKDNFDSLRIASPCPTSWSQMAGDDRVRFCDLCNLHVYNIAQLTGRETEELIGRTEGRVCARLYRRTDGTIITKDCPVGLRAIRRRAAKVAGAVFATIMSLCSIVVGQKPSSKDKSSCKQQITVVRKLSDSASDYGVAGTILDPNGAVVAGAKVIVTDRKTKKSRETESNSDGHFLMAGLTPGVYDVGIKSPGFKRLEVSAVTLAEKETISFEVLLIADAITVTVGIISDTPLLETSTPGTTIFSGDLIRRLPH